MLPFTQFLSVMLLVTITFSTLSAQSKEEKAAVEKTLQNYLEGGTNGDTTRLIAAFHPSASMKFVDNKTGEFKDIPIATYLDGGLHSILPIEMAFEKSVDMVIAVDVAEVSRFSPQQWRWHKQYHEQLIYIRPSKMLPSPLNFADKARNFQLELGYKDAVEILNQNMGLLQKEKAA